MVDRGRNLGWGLIVRMKMLCSVSFNVVFQIMQGLRKEMVVLVVHDKSNFWKRKHRCESSSRHVDSLTVFSKCL